MESGQRLHDNTPRPGEVAVAHMMNERINQWISSGVAWGKEVNEYLKQSSPRAAATFVLIADSYQQANPQIVYLEGGYPFSIQGPQRETYQRLTAQLNNLRSIMERPDVYF